MNDMVDGLLAALPDSAFYGRGDFGADLIEKLRESDVPFVCHLRGAASWDPSRQPIYPLYSVSKTNTEDNPVFIPYRYGSAVISSEDTGEAIVFPLREDEGKTPLANRPARVPSRPDLPRAKTYSTTGHWREVPADALRGGYGAYRIFMHAGDFQSEPYTVQVAPPADPEWKRPFEALLETAGAPAPDGSGAIDLGVAGAVFGAPKAEAFPKEDGVELVPMGWDPAQGVAASAMAAQGAGNATPGAFAPRFPVQGNFRFTGEWPEKALRLPLHFLIGGDDVRELRVVTLGIPRAACLFQDGQGARQQAHALGVELAFGGDLGAGRARHLLQRSLQRSGVQRRAAQPSQRGRAASDGQRVVHARGRQVGERPGRVLAQRAQLLRRGRVAAQVGVAQRPRADGHRAPPAHALVRRADRQLGRAAPEVDHRDAPRQRLVAHAHRAGEGQARLVVGVQDGQLEARRAPNRADQLPPIGGISDRRRGHRDHPRGARPLGGAGLCSDDVHELGQLGRADRPVRALRAAHPREDPLLEEHAQAVDGRLGDEQTRGVGPDVDDGEHHVLDDPRDVAMMGG
jgi:hypothetical protein